MPPLLNAQHEIFAQEVAKGRQIGEAYALAGFNPHPANPTRLGKKRHVAERIKEIKEKATERAAEQLVISKKRVLEELAKIAFANMADFMTIGASGEPGRGHAVSSPGSLPPIRWAARSPGLAPARCAASAEVTSLRFMTSGLACLLASLLVLRIRGLAPAIVPAV